MMDSGHCYSVIIMTDRTNFYVFNLIFYVPLTSYYPHFSFIYIYIKTFKYTPCVERKMMTQIAWMLNRLPAKWATTDL